MKCIISHSEVLGTLRMTPCITLCDTCGSRTSIPANIFPACSGHYSALTAVLLRPTCSKFFVLCKTALPERLPFTRSIWLHCEKVNDCSFWWTHKQRHWCNSTERCRLISSLFFQGKISFYTVVTVNWDCRSTGHVEITAGRRGWGLSRHSKPGMEASLSPGQMVMPHRPFVCPPAVFIKNPTEENSWLLPLPETSAQLSPYPCCGQPQMSIHPSPGSSFPSPVTVVHVPCSEARLCSCNLFLPLQQWPYLQQTGCFLLPAETSDIRDLCCGV